MGPAAVRHRVQPGQLHALPAVTLRVCVSLRLLAEQDLVRAEEPPTAAIICPPPSTTHIKQDNHEESVTVPKQ